MRMRCRFSITLSDIFHYQGLENQLFIVYVYATKIRHAGLIFFAIKLYFSRNEPTNVSNVKRSSVLSAFSNTFVTMYGHHKSVR